jgi:hypothetical protein
MSVNTILVFVVGNTNSDFSIDGSSGAVTVAKALDFSSTSSYSLQFTADDGAQTETLTVVINIKTRMSYISI